MPGLSDMVYEVHDPFNLLIQILLISFIQRMRCIYNDLSELQTNLLFTVWSEKTENIYGMKTVHSQQLGKMDVPGTHSSPLIEKSRRWSKYETQSVNSGENLSMKTFKFIQASNMPRSQINLGCSSCGRVIKEYRTVQENNFSVVNMNNSS